MHDGAQRRYRLVVPDAYRVGQPMPVVLDFHGRHGSAESQALLSGLDAVGDREGFIVVQPQGEGGDSTWNAGFCCGGAQSNGVDDVGATSSLIDDLDARLCIDADRIFATGMSNGGFMAHRLGCELADRIAAIAPVAGGNLMLACDPARPMPVFHFHGLADAIVPFEGFAGFVSIPDSMAGWVARNGCRSGPEVFFNQADVTCERWTDCDDDVTVQLCRIQDGGHTWPGGPAIPGLGNTTQTISASQMMWEFFQAHPR
jgi:polyhydroxybutyrate depolymerase